MTPARAIAMIDAAVLKHGKLATLKRGTSTSDKRLGTVTTTTSNLSVRVLTKEQEVESEGGLKTRTTEVVGRFSTEPKVGDFLSLNSVDYRITCVHIKVLAGTPVAHTLTLGPQ